MRTLNDGFVLRVGDCAVDTCRTSWLPANASARTVAAPDVARHTVFYAQDHPAAGWRWR